MAILNLKKLFLPILMLLFVLESSWASVPAREFFSNNCSHQKKYIFLDKDQLANLNNKLSINTPRIIQRYFVDCQSENGEYYILNDKVRTHYQTVLIYIRKKKIKRVEVLEFGEPQQYNAPKKWVEQLAKETKIEEIDALSGATLTRQSLVKLGRLAIYLSNEFKDRP